MTISSLLKKIDMFGFNYSFLIGGKERYKSCFGSVLTIIYLLIIVGLFIGFGRDMYMRRKPKVSYNSIQGEHRKFQLSNQNFTYAFRLEDQNGEIINDSSLLYTQITYFNYEVENGKWVIKEKNFKEVKNCYDLDYTKEKEKYYNISLEKWNCVDFENVTVGGGWDGNFVSGFHIETFQCINFTNLPNNCATEENFHTKFNQNFTYYSDLYLELMPSLDNYDQPLKTQLRNKIELLDININKVRRQNFKVSYIDDDKGWLLPTIERSGIFSSESSQNDFSLKNPFYQNNLFTNNIYFDRNYENYSRSFIKVQEVFAYIGGFMNIFLRILNYIFGLFLQKNRTLYLINNLFDNEIENDKEDLKEINKNNNNFYNSDRKIIIDQSSTHTQNNLNKNLNLELTKINIEKKHSIKLKNHEINYSRGKLNVCSYYNYFLLKRKKAYDENSCKILDSFELYFNNYKKVMNISSYFKLYHDFDKLKYLIMKDDKNNSINKNTNLDNLNNLKNLSYIEMQNLEQQNEASLVK